MIKISPASMLVNFDGSPIPSGEIADGKVRLALAALKDEAAKAPAGEQAVRDEEYQQALVAAQKPLTLGTVLITVLQAGMEGDDKAGAKVKIGRDVLSCDIYRAELAAGQVELSAQQIVSLTERVARVYSPRVVAQVVRCLEGRDESAAAGASG